MTQSVEVNFDSIIGPTHHYAGLARGNLASQTNRLMLSNPREAALQGLEKMRRVMQMGVPQAVLPPQERPDVAALRAMGFSGEDQEVIAAAGKTDLGLLSACSSASAMWAANAATVSPSADTEDRRVHFTPANLAAHLHRSLEAGPTAHVLLRIFADPRHFVHHPPLPAALADEGAANHMRLAPRHGSAGVEVFVYGRDGFEGSNETKSVARQTRRASEAVARLHGTMGRSLFLRQNPAAVAAGVFHNDVIAVANENLMLCHQTAFAEDEAVARIREAYHELALPAGASAPLVCIIPESMLSLEEAVRSYLFNSQLLSTPQGMVLLAPADCLESPGAQRAVQMILGTTPVKKVEYVDVRQSMRNGGGPACLRLRVVLTEAELAATHQGIFLTPALYEQLRAWIIRHYRDRLTVEDLRDVALLHETRAALQELMAIVHLSGPHCPPPDCTLGAT